ncbi:hypothetical protein BSPWISOXPB_11228 [uncultured Gammaproteobacteria bacterium]|nr:hypothetical protein BSPWISOXPB_11228 [uncultured Gammaproteobacteria bacterium]
MHPLIVAIPRFIQLGMPLLPLKPMAQLRRGVVRVMEAQVHPLVVVIPKFIQLTAPLPAVKADGSITVWGDSSYGGAGAPSGGGYTKIYSTGGALSPLKPMAQSRCGVIRIMEGLSLHPIKYRLVST